MVKITYEEYGGKFSLEFEGHAGISSDDKPHYLCAAVSSIFYGLGQKLMTMDDEGFLDYLKCDDKDDIKSITAETSDNAMILYHVFDTAICGLQLLAEAYPDSIDLTA